MGEEKLYISSKLYLGIPMDECTFLKQFKGEDVTNRETRAGYKVTYPDGYVSWSPKETFEIASREVTEAEMSIMWPGCEDEQDVPDINAPDVDGD